MRGIFCRSCVEEAFARANGGAALSAAGTAAGAETVDQGQPQEQLPSIRDSRCSLVASSRAAALLSGAQAWYFGNA
jgi:hypothetical protein